MQLIKIKIELNGVYYTANFKDRNIPFQSMDTVWEQDGEFVKSSDVPAGVVRFVEKAKKVKENS